MQSTQSQYLKTLSEYDPNTQYLRINASNELMLCSKADLKWGHRVIRCFWKPKTERIAYVAQMVFAHVNNDILKQLSNDSINLTRVFLQLGKLAERADKKTGTKCYSDRAFAAQDACFVKLAVLDKAMQPQYALEESIAKLTEMKLKEEAELKMLQKIFSEEESELKAQIESTHGVLTGLLDQKTALEFEIVTKTDDQRVLQDDVRKIEADYVDTAKKIESLEFQKRCLESDTVLWAEDGFVLCQSSFFSSTSMVNCETMSRLIKPSAKVEQKLNALQGEKSEVLRSIPKQIYIENAKVINIKQFMSFLENGPGHAKEYLAEDYSAIRTIADFLLQEPPNFETPVIADLNSKMNEVNAELERRKLEKKSLKTKIDKINEKLGLGKDELKALKNKIGKLKAELEQSELEKEKLKRKTRHAHRH